MEGSVPPSTLVEDPQPQGNSALITGQSAHLHHLSVSPSLPPSLQDISNLGRWCRCTESIILHGQSEREREREMMMLLCVMYMCTGLMPEMAGPDEELHSYIARQK